MPFKLIESTVWPPNGPLSIFQDPLVGHQYVIGADTAEGLEHGDAACAAVLDVETDLLVAMYHALTEPYEFGEELVSLGRYYNSALIGCEANNHGFTTITAIRKLGYPRIFRRRTIGQVSEKFAPQFGWLTNKATKPKMIDDLNQAIKSFSIDIRCEYTLAELRTYIREYTSGGGVKMHGSPHDDRVMALAIAWQMIPYVYIMKEEENEVVRGTFEQAMQLAQESNERPREKRGIGWQSVRKGRLG